MVGQDDSSLFSLINNSFYTTSDTSDSYDLELQPLLV